MLAIIDCDGYIFGGAVRDWHIHENAANKFYEAHKGQPSHKVDTMYNDCTYMPALIDRTVVPVDIDACIHASDLQRLLDMLTEKRIYATRIFTHDPVQYIPHLELQPNEIQHMRFKIDIVPKIFTMFSTPIVNEIETLLSSFKKQLDAQTQGLKPFMIDLMVVNVPKTETQPVAPFGNLDFECNGLVASKNGIQISRHLRKNFDPMHYDKSYHRIMNDILEKKAVIALHGEQRCNAARIEKMISKGWTITGFKSVKFIEECSSTTASNHENHDMGHCMICHDEIHTKPHYKMVCCNGRFHLNCLLQAMTTGVSAMVRTRKCLMCQRHVRDPQIDHAVLAAIESANKISLSASE